MNIRNTVLASLFFVFCLFLLATGWLGKQALGRFQQHVLVQAQEELLEQGAGEFVNVARQFCNAYRLMKDSQDPGLSDAGVLAKASALTPDLVLAFDAKGAPLPGVDIDPAITDLVTPEAIQEFYEKSARGELTELTMDNNRAYLENKIEAPVIAHFVAIPESQMVVGLGRIQNLAEIRNDSLGKVGAAEMAGLVRRTIGLYVFLMMLTLSLAWFVLHIVFFKPLVNTFAYAGVSSPGAGLNWGDLKEYAGHLREVLEQKESIRSKLEQETEARFQAEEERDRTRNQLDHALDKFERAIEARYASRLNEAQSQLMRREARALKRHIQQPLESAHAKAIESGAVPELVELIERGLDTVRCLSDDGDSISYSPKPVALQPWLEEVVKRFGETHGANVDTGIQNGMLVNIDSGSMEKALEYVMENALHASPSDKSIAVDAVRFDERVEIRIIDRGVGIDGGARAHILVPFFTLEEGRDGLGLAITRSVIRHHGGNLAIRSESEKGTAVIISLPLAHAQG